VGISFRTTAVGAATFAVGFSLLAQNQRPTLQVPALSTLQLVASNAIPAHGSFHRLTKLDWPALPFDNVPGCPVYWLGANVHVIDDAAYNYAERTEQA
jgi:hypothetical protein